MSATTRLHGKRISSQSKFSVADNVMRPVSSRILDIFLAASSFTLRYSHATPMFEVGETALQDALKKESHKMAA